MTKVKKTYRKNILRELAASKSRFVSLFGIILLGVMMLSGLLSIAPDMRRAGQSYYVRQNVFDIRVASTLGLSEGDIAAIAATEGVEAAMPVRSVDCEGTYRGGNTLAVRVQELPACPEIETKENMNRLTLASGRMPAETGECVVQVLDAGAKGELRLGDTVTLTGAEDAKAQTLTVVGFVKDPLYFSNQTESTTAGNGSLGMAIYVPQGELTMDYYSSCYIKVEDAAGLDNYSDEYRAAVGAVAARLEDISAARSAQRRGELIADAEARLADARAAFTEQEAEARRQFAEAEARIADAEAQLADAKARLEQGEAEYADGARQLAAQKAALPDTMESGAAQLLEAEAQVLDFESRLAEIKQLVSLKQVADPLLGYAEDILDNARSALEEAEPEDENYIELRDLLARAEALYDSTYSRLADYQAQLDAGKAEMYAQGLISAPDLSNDALVTEAEAALREMKLQVMQGQLALSTGSASAWTAFDEAEAQLADARARLDEGWTEYNDGTARLEASKTEYETRKADAEAQLADARSQINDAEEQVDDIAAGEWYVLDRGSVLCMVFFEQNADRIESIARIFPVFFFLVAALVASTTMTRMVEENRTQMGTLKALGYSDREITAKYLVYGIAAGLLGCAGGMALGFFGLPSVIWYAYATVFDLPTFELVVYPGLVALSIAISAGIIGLATLTACRVSLRERPAALLLPRAPAAGKRIFLERIGPLWRRMSFSQKTTARNIFRYKKRFYMTVLGVAGCTALLLIGFGLQDSIVAIIDRQYTELDHADLTVSLSSDKALRVEGGLAELLDSREEVESWGAFYTRTVSLYNADGSELSATLVAPEDERKLSEYFTLRTMQSGETIPFGRGSVVLSEKTAELLGVGVGDGIWVQASDGSRVELTLTGVTENYLGAYLFVTEEALGSLVSDPSWNTVYAETSCGADSERSALRALVLGCNYVSSASFSSEAAGIYDSTIDCINYVVLLIILCAAALAAVVLYNLISVNIGERKKELATIKVLGFYDREVYRYIFREIELLSALGAALGLAVGAPMHQFMIRTVEAEQMMFIRRLEPTSYLYSAALTLLFTLAVCRFMRGQVRRISMVESMKAPE